MKKLLSLTLAMLLVLSCLAGVSFAADAEATWTNGVTTAEGTLAEMAKQASAAGGTITLQKDVTSDKDSGYAVSSNSSFTFDLNGHTLTSAAGGVCVTSSDKGATGMFVVKNGTIISRDIAISCNKGGLAVDGVTAATEKKQSIIYNEASGEYNKDNIIQNSAFYCAAWGVLSFNNTKADQSAAAMTFKNCTLASAKSALVVRQKQAGSPTVLLGEGMKMYTTAAAAVDKNLKVSGEAVTKADGTHAVTVATVTAENMNLFTTPETATVTLEVPTATAPVQPETPVSTTGAKDVASAKASWTNGLTTQEGTLKELFGHASKNGGTVTLLEDVEYIGDTNFPLSATGPFTLDMNGHTYTSAKGNISTGFKSEGVFVIKNGTLISNGQANLNIRGAGLQVLNMTLWSKTNQNINYYEATDLYNKDNLIEGSTLANPIWYCISFNDTGANQEAASITVKNSTLAAVKAKGSAPLGLQTKPEGSSANVVLGEGVKLYSYAKSAANAALVLLGEELTQSEGTKSVTIVNETYDMLNEWTTPATATKDLAAVIPGNTPAHNVDAPAAPAEPETPATPAPLNPGKTEDEKKDDTTTPSVKPTMKPMEEESGMNVGVIIAVVAAVVVIAAVAVIVLKKKKK